MTKQLHRPRLIALDWGTTHLRAYLVEQQGSVIDAITTAKGILNVANNDFEAVFEELIGPWLSAHQGLAVIASGMIGSRQGWCETPYIDCPAGVTQIAARLTPLTTRRGITLWLVPGVSFEDAFGVPDVMRGEETQIMGQFLGQAAKHHEQRQVFVLPGTHSKWVLVENEQITWFATFMSGEVFALLHQHSILGRLMEGTNNDPAAFRKGIDYAAATAPSQGGLLKRLFSARTLGLFDKIPATGLHAYLSGLVIGSEINEALACVGLNNVGLNNNDAISIIGSSTLSQLYLDAFTSRGLQCSVGDADAVVAGLCRIAQDADLLEGYHG